LVFWEEEEWEEEERGGAGGTAEFMLKNDYLEDGMRETEIRTSMVGWQGFSGAGGS
jgi:hypothetical protein